MEQLIIAVGGGLAMAALVGIAKLGSGAYDRRRVHEWLRSNTRDWPRESHKTTKEIAKGASLTVERARVACESDKRVHLSKAGEWSVWRQEPESIYEKRGLLRF